MLESHLEDSVSQGGALTAILFFKAPQVISLCSQAENLQDRRLGLKEDGGVRMEMEGVGETIEKT